MTDSSFIDAGDGDNSVIVTGGEAGMYASKVATGTGNDNISVTGANGPAMAGSSISAGAGDDIAVINGNVQNSSIYMGDGNDTLFLNGYVTGASKLDGGFNAALDFERGQLGDVLVLNHELASGLVGADALGGITAVNTTGFESLYLALANGAEDCLNLDELLATLGDKGFSGDNSFKAIVISGNEVDSINMGSGQWSLTQSDALLENFQGLSFDRYTMTSGNEVPELYLQTGIL